MSASDQYIQLGKNLLLMVHVRPALFILSSQSELHSPAAPVTGLQPSTKWANVIFKCTFGNPTCLTILFEYELLKKENI